jgi:sugar lactone lactonase YvrE
MIIRIGCLGLLLCRAMLAGEPDPFIEGSTWEFVSGGHNIVEGIAASGKDVFLTDVPDHELFRITSDGGQLLVDTNTGGANGLALGPDGHLYGACMNKPAITVWNMATGVRSEIPVPAPANDLVITPGKDLFYTWGPSNAVYRLNLVSLKAEVAASMPNPNGIALALDGRELFVAEFSGDTVRAFPLSTNGILGPGRAAFKARVPANGRGLLDGMVALQDGRLLVATALGVQILSADGAAILIPNPTNHRANYVRIFTDASGVRWLYVAHEKTVLRRKTRLK